MQPQENSVFGFQSRSVVLCLILGGLLLALYASDPAWQSTAEVLRNGVVLTWMISLVNIVLPGHGLGKVFGIRPRHLIGLLGVVFSPLLHRDLSHLIANTVPFLVLGWLVLLQGEIQGGTDFYTITATILLIGGLGTWLFGREAIHLGASGLIFGYIGFLLAGAYVGPTLLTLGLAAVVFWIYGAQLWGMMPSSSEDRVSWEGHLFGFAGGVVAGVRPDFLAEVVMRVGDRLAPLLQ